MSSIEANLGLVFGEPSNFKTSGLPRRAHQQVGVVVWRSGIATSARCSCRSDGGKSSNTQNQKRKDQIV